MLPVNQKKSSILDQYGNPYVKQQTGLKPRALHGGLNNIPYDAADTTGSSTSNWFPYLTSPDVELNPWRDIIVSRVRDLVRNDGWASGIVTRVLDNALGGCFRPISKPDYRTLQAKTGCSFDAQWAKEWSREVDSHWRSWANDEGRYCDAGRRLTFSQMMWAAMRGLLIDGDAVAVLNWIPDRVQKGQALYATAVQMIDPDRLCNPNNNIDSEECRGGVQIDSYGSPIGYHFRKSHLSNYFDLSQTMTWEYIKKETPWGRPQVVHYFETNRADEHRGGAGILTPIVQRLRMITKYDKTELDAAVVNATFAAFLESPYDPVSGMDALETQESENILNYIDNRNCYHKNNNLVLGGTRIPVLFPGEKISAVSSSHPHSGYREFLGAALRNIAAGTGVSTQQISNDWSDVNYSSARSAMLEAWKTLTRRRDNFGNGFASPIRSAWLEECCMKEELPWPSGVDLDYLMDMVSYLKTPLSKCKWLGPGRGWVDPVAEKQGAVLGMAAGLSTLEVEAAENSGDDWEEIIDQRALEIKKFKENGIPLPDWTGNQTNGKETSISSPPEKPSP